MLEAEVAKFPNGAGVGGGKLLKDAFQKIAILSNSTIESVKHVYYRRHHERPGLLLRENARQILTDSDHEVCLLHIRSPFPLRLILPTRF